VTQAVVDASLVLAWLQEEPGSDDAEPLLLDGVIGAANWSEVLQKARQHGVPFELAARLLASFGLQVADVTREDGERAASLWRTKSPLSLGDRLCLALGWRLRLPVATTDAAWAAAGAGVEVIVVR
jgi:PIN domain nuclease of toxin-antitoxin system